MNIDVEILLNDIYSAVISAKFNSVVRLDCENDEAYSTIKLAIRVGKIASVIKLKNLQVDVVLLDPHQQAQIPVCSDCGESLSAISDNLTEEKPTLGGKDSIVFSANEGTIIVLMGALFAISKSQGLFDDDDQFSDFLYNVIDCGVNQIERIPDVAKNELLIAAKKAVNYHVKQNQRHSKTEPSEQTR